MLDRVHARGDDVGNVRRHAVGRDASASSVNGVNHGPDDLDRVGEPRLDPIGQDLDPGCPSRDLLEGGVDETLGRHRLVTAGEESTFKCELPSCRDDGRQQRVVGQLERDTPRRAHVANEQNALVARRAKLLERLRHAQRLSIRDREVEVRVDEAGSDKSSRQGRGRRCP